MDTNIITVILILTSLILALAGFAFLVIERRHAFIRERTLVYALISKGLTELAQTNSKLISTPKDLKDITKLENKLAEIAATLQQSEADGIPI